MPALRHYVLLETCSPTSLYEKPLKTTKDLHENKVCLAVNVINGHIGYKTTLTLSRRAAKVRPNLGSSLEATSRTCLLGRRRIRALCYRF